MVKDLSRIEWTVSGERPSGRSLRPVLQSAAKRQMARPIFSYYLFRKCSLYRLPAVLNRLPVEVRTSQRTFKQKTARHHVRFILRGPSALNLITPNNIRRGSCDKHVGMLRAAAAEQSSIEAAAAAAARRESRRERAGSAEHAAAAKQKSARLRFGLKEKHGNKMHLPK